MCLDLLCPFKSGKRLLTDVITELFYLLVHNDFMSFSTKKRHKFSMTMVTTGILYQISVLGFNMKSKSVSP